MKTFSNFKLIVAIGVILAASATAFADTYTTADEAGRTYLVPSEGELAGKKLMELSAPSLEGRYRLACFGNSTYHLDIAADAQNQGTNVQIWDSNQDFDVILVSDGYYKIQRGNMVLDVKDGKGEANANIQVWSWNGSDAQLWKLLKNDDGSFHIVTKLNENLALDVDGAVSSDKFSNGVNVHLYNKDDNMAQKWTLEPYSSDIASLQNRRVTDSYFEKYLIENFAQVYNESTHTITGKATLQRNYTIGRADAGSNEHIVIDCDAITEFNALGEYGDYGDVENGGGKKYFHGVYNLKGIEYFTNLKKLELNRNVPGDNLNYQGNYTVIQEGNIDLQYNTNLEYLDLDYATLTEVGTTGIDKLSKLKYLNLSDNNFKYFNITPYPSLERLEMTHNFNLMGIKADRNENLFELAIFDSMYGYDSQYSLQSLVDNFPNLVLLHAFSTFNTSLDLSQHTKLQSVWLHKSIYGARQLPKGNWLHSLDLSGCTELRDIHVQNMHIASLNIPSAKLGQPLTDEYKDLQYSREVTSVVTARGGKLVPYVEVNNNYRHIGADLSKWYNAANGKYYYVYYLRTNWTGNDDTEPVLANKKGYYDVISYDSYTDDNSYKDKTNWSTKRINLENTLADDFFDANKVTACGTASMQSTLETRGVTTHSNTDSTPLCMMADGGVVSNPEAIDADILRTFSGKVNGSIIILKAGCAYNEDCDDSTDAPTSVCYTYNICSADGADPVNGYFYFDLDYPAKGVVTEVTDINANKQVASVTYYSPTGVASDTAFDGVNIKLTRYTDGTTSATKLVK